MYPLINTLYLYRKMKLIILFCLTFIDFGPTDPLCIADSGLLSTIDLITKGRLFQTPPMFTSSAIEHNNQQRIYPNIQFNCTGRIVTITVAGLERSSTTAQGYPELQLWRESQQSRQEFQLVDSVSLSEMTRTTSLNVYRITPKQTVAFKRGDSFGLYTPHRWGSRFVIQFQPAVGGKISASYSSTVITSIINLNNSKVEQDFDIPMMIIETGEHLNL